jgi:hypothetical protein
MTEPETLPERPVDPDWLALREPADTRSRDAAAAQIVEPLLQHLRDRLDDRRRDRLGDSEVSGLRVVDLGSGTGANVRWLATRLAALGGPAGLAAQRWTLVDHDPRLRSWGPVETATVRADVSHLPDVLAELDDVGGVDLVTAAALLDLLDGPQLTAVVDAVVAKGVPALFALSVTGVVCLDPADPLDGLLATAFDAHQRRGRRLGPDAGRESARQFRGHGWRVVEAATPWQLTSSEPELLDAWLVGRVEAAVEWEPALAGRADRWLEQRRAQLADALLSALVNHVDVLALPQEADIR